MSITTTRDEAIECFACVTEDLDRLAHDCSHLTHAEVSDWANDMGRALARALYGVGLNADVNAKVGELFPDEEGEDEQV